MPSLTGSSRLGRSVTAVIAGAFVGGALSVATDLLLHAIGIAPALGEAFSNPLLVLAVIYRSMYGVLGSYVCARIAPGRPMGHCLVLGSLGCLANLVGAVTTWNASPSLGPHWYTVALAFLALPTAWLGGKIFTARSNRTPA